MPKSHQKYKGWNEEDFMNRAASIGEQTAISINRLLASKALIEQTYDGCLGVLRADVISAIRYNKKTPISI